MNSKLIWRIGWAIIAVLVIALILIVATGSWDWMVNEVMCWAQETMSGGELSKHIHIPMDSKGPTFSCANATIATI